MPFSVFGSVSLWLGTVLWGLISGAPAHGQSVRITADSAVYRVGSPIKLQIEARLPDAREVFFPALADTLAPGLERIQTDASKQWPTDSGTLYRQRWTLMAFDSGQFLIPPQRMQWLDAQGDTQSLQTHRLDIDVRLMHTDSAQLADIDPVMSVPINWWDYWPYGLAAAVLILAAIGSYYYWKRRKQTPEINPRPQEPDTPPGDAALRALRSLLEEEAWLHRNSKSFYDSLSNILRKYIEARLGVPALEMTSRELRHALGSGSSADDPIPAMHQLFHTADMVKFARMEVPAAQAKNHLMAAIQWVENQEQPREAMPSESGEASTSAIST